MDKNRSIRPPYNDNLGLASEFVHEMDGPLFGSLSTWTDGWPADGRLRPWRPGTDRARVGRFFVPF